MMSRLNKKRVYQIVKAASDCLAKDGAHPVTQSRAYIHEALNLLRDCGVEREITARWLHCIAIAIMDFPDDDENWADPLNQNAPISEAEGWVRLWISKP